MLWQSRGYTVPQVVEGLGRASPAELAWNVGVPGQQPAEVLVPPEAVEVSLELILCGARRACITSCVSS